MSTKEFDLFLRTVHDSASTSGSSVDEEQKSSEEEDMRLFAALTWPRVRPVMTMQVEGFTLCCHKTELMWESDTSVLDIRCILQAAADGAYLAPDSKIPTNMIRLVRSTGEQCPVIDFSVLEKVRAQLLKREFSEWIPDTVHLKGLSNKGWTTFEENAFRTLALFLCFFYHRRKLSHPLPTVQKTSRLTDWVPKSVKMVKTITLKKNRSHNHPFKGQSHEHREELSPQFVNSLKKLKKTGDTILLYCGGSAALDFILVMKGRNALQVRYADAKHTVDPKNVRPKAGEMRKKTKNVHNSLRELLEGQFTVPKWKASNLLLITNSHFEAAHVMSPLTTTWEPMTRVLYCSTAKKADEDEGEEEEEDDDDEDYDEDDEEEEEEQGTSRKRQRKRGDKGKSDGREKKARRVQGGKGVKGGKKGKKTGNK